MADILVGYFVASKQNNTFTVANHGLINGDTVRYSLGAAGNALPTPVVEGTWYYVVNAATDTWQVSVASGGAAIVLTDAGTGSNEAWSPAPVANVWVYEMLTGGINEPELIPDVSEVNYYAQRGWELMSLGQGLHQQSRFWFLMRKQEPAGTTG